EATPLRPVSRYGASKAAMEAAIQPYHDRLRLTVVRPPAVYGPREADIYTVLQTAARYRVFAVVGDPRPPARTCTSVSAGGRGSP
ncbi:NAD-dependent epimerase/dehydratase family protein, partial [Alkalihalophilus lindianensis]